MAPGTYYWKATLGVLDGVHQLMAKIGLIDPLAMVFKAGSEIGVLKRNMILIACCFIFATVVFFPRLGEHTVPLRVGKVGPDSGLPLDPRYPYPEYNSSSWRVTWRGRYRPCIGPGGGILNFRDESTAMTGYQWNQSEFPAPIFGGYEPWSLDASLCVDPQSRYGAYGYQVRGPANGTSQIPSFINEDWDGVNWADLQQICLENNYDRYNMLNPADKRVTLHKDPQPEVKNEEGEIDEPPNANVNGESHMNQKRQRYTKEGIPTRAHPRSAVILRSWLGKEYTENDILNIRAMIMELSLLSGAEYEVILLIDAHDEILPDSADKASIEELKKELPEELRGLAVYFNMEILKNWYPLIEAHQAMFQYFQPVQIFSQLHPQYDYIWQFEMDSRYTGHHYHLLEQATAFAKKQPRQNLWERNSYFYIPSIHGTWDNFTKMVDASMIDRKTIWGPVPVEGLNVSSDSPIPPRKPSNNETSTWGIGEEADVITWLPQFNPQNTDWPYREIIYNFIQGPSIPRRASPVAMSRLSARVLKIMHENLVDEGLSLVSEMTPASMALYHGLKAVQIPQPVYHAHEWDPVELDRRANTNLPGYISAGQDSIWTWDLAHDILKNMTYMFDSDFSGRLYQAWLGNGEVEEWKRENRSMCLPPMLLHPVKDTVM